MKSKKWYHIRYKELGSDTIYFTELKAHSLQEAKDIVSGYNEDIATFEKSYRISEPSPMYAEDYLEDEE